MMYQYSATLVQGQEMALALPSYQLEEAEIFDALAAHSSPDVK